MPAKLNIHLIGIGGIGVSALSQYYLSQGYNVSGSDLVSSEIIELIEKKGVKVSIGKHKTSNLPKKVDFVVYSPAVQKDNPELLEAKKRGIGVKSYPQALGELTKKHFTIAVSGTHGKSTTASMLGLLLTKTGLDPTIIIGTKLKEFGNSNFRIGKSKYLVIEADEHLASFLNYWPKILVLTSVEADHLDYYGNLSNMIKVFKEYVSHLPKDGVLVMNADDKNIKQVLSKKDFKIREYKLKQKEAKLLRLKVPGDFNISNALAALTVARELGIADKVSFKALSEYKGCWRRFEIVCEKPCVVISDYAHHPTEVEATLKAAKEKYGNKPVLCVFQPHQYQRTYYLKKEFSKVLKNIPIDKLILTDIYDVAGREGGDFRKKIDSEKLAKEVNKKNVVYLEKSKILKYLKDNGSQFEVLIIMGAGDIYKIAKPFCLTNKQKKRKM